MRYFILIYNAMIWGLLAAVIVTRNLWLDMRINTGLIIPAVIVITIIVGLIAKSKLRMTSRFTLVNIILCFILTFLVLGVKRLVVIPASIIRETINMTGLSFSVVNWILIIVLTLGLIIIWVGGRKTK